MKNNKKLLTAIAGLALSGAMALGVAGLTACNNNNNQSSAYKPATSNSHTISTATGPVAVDESAGHTWYIGVNGKSVDENPAGTKEDPYDIMAIADARVFAAGDTVRVLPGVYVIPNQMVDGEERLGTAPMLSITRGGEYNKYLTIMNDSTPAGGGVPTQEVIIDFSNQVFASTSRGVAMDASYIHWYGIDVRGAGDNGLYVSGSYNTIEYSEFYNNRDSGLQFGRRYSEQTDISEWPSFNLVKNCTSHNNYDNEYGGENADGFAAKLTVGYGNVFDGCIAYRNSDDGWDLYAKVDSGNIGTVVLYNCVAFENGYLEYTQNTYNKLFSAANKNAFDNVAAFGDSYFTTLGDGNGFKLGGSAMEGDVYLYNCLSFNNKMHGVTDNSNPGVLSINNVTSYDNGRNLSDETGNVIAGPWNSDDEKWCGNIDVSRQTYSYNNLSGVLSIKGQLYDGTAGDAYRGSVRNSILTPSDTYKITTYIDADSKNNISGTKMDTAPVDTEVFAKLPVTATKSVDGQTVTYEYTYNLTGARNLGEYDQDGNLTLNAQRMHKILRNSSDGSINMGDYFRITDQAKLLGADTPIGAVLNKTSYGDYTHFYSDPENVQDETDYQIDYVYDTLILNTDVGAVYQDFDLPVNMQSATISWVSSDETILKVSTDVDKSVSGSQYVRAIVYRQEDGDKYITLTATITLNGKTKEKVFNLKIVKDVPTIGTIFVNYNENSQIMSISAGDSIIVDQYSIFREPTVSVENGADYNGKLLDPSKYTIESKYVYQVSKDSPAKYEIKGFTPSVAGYYTITKTVKLKDNSAQKDFTYSIFVASPAAKVDFSGDPTIVVNMNGYMIGGTLGSATGSIYALSSPTQLTDVTPVNIKTYTGVTKYDFRSDTINFQFANDNNAGYYIYFALANVNGDVTSKVYEQSVSSVEISTHEDFVKVAGGVALKDEDVNKTIYTLATDLDFTQKGWTMWADTKGKFKGLLNGKGHTVSGITVNDSTLSDQEGDKGRASVFCTVEGGTIMNIKFKDISITTTGIQVGIVGTVKGGGYFYNIALENISVRAAQRASALIGQISDTTDIPVTISQVSVVNDDSHELTSPDNGSRIGGLIGYVQTSKKADIYIDNCYVSTDITTKTEAGGIIASWEDDAGSHLNIVNCYYIGTITTTASTSGRGAGMLGYHKQGAGILRITRCLSLATLVNGPVGSDPLIVASKNNSPIVGGYSANADAQVGGCIGLMEEHNAAFDSQVLEGDGLTYKSTFGEYLLNFDTETRWSFVDADNDGTLEAPYVTLNFLGNWA